MIIARQRFGKHVPGVMLSIVDGPPLLCSKSLGMFRSNGSTQNITEELFEVVFWWSIPCEGGVEYLHRNPVSPRRRRKGKSRIWDNKIWWLVPQDSDPRMTGLARASSSCKRQTRPLVRESAPHQQSRSCLTAIKIWS
jgi:hypothetical protein